MTSSIGLSHAVDRFIDTDVSVPAETAAAAVETLRRFDALDLAPMLGLAVAE